MKTCKKLDMGVTLFQKVGHGRQKLDMGVTIRRAIEGEPLVKESHFKENLNEVRLTAFAVNPHLLDTFSLKDDR